MKRFLLVVVLLVGVWLTGISGLLAQDNGTAPTAVGLLYFTATVQADGVRLDWETATEQNSASFMIQRSSDGSSFDMLGDIGFIASTGDVATGATYSVVDKTAVPGQTYTYKLVEIETNSSQNELETVTILFDPQPTATSIVIGGSNPTPRPSNTPAAAATTAPSATATRTPVATASTRQATATPRSTATRQPTTTPENSNTTTNLQPTAVQQTLPTASPQLDQAFGEGATGSGEASPGVVLAQEEPTAYPGQDTTPPDTTTDTGSYPPGQEPVPATESASPTPYPASTSVEAAPTLAIIGSDDPYPPETNLTATAPSAEVIRGRILLWASFLIALFIFLSGVVGAIVLYRRRPA